MRDGGLLIKIRASLACSALVASILLLTACGPAPTRTAAVIVLATMTKTALPSLTPTPTPTPTTTGTPTTTSTAILTATPAVAISAEPAVTPTLTSTAIPAAMTTLPSTTVPTATPTMSSTAMPTSTATPTPTPSYTAAPMEEPTDTPSPTPTATETPSPAPTQAPSPTNTAPPQVHNELVGTWREDSGYYWQFLDDGTYCLGGAPPGPCQDPLTTGIFWLIGTQLVIRDTGGRSVCGSGGGDPGWDGIYVIFLTPNETFSLMLAHDPCPSRTQIVTLSPWYWVP